MRTRRSPRNQERLWRELGGAPVPAPRPKAVPLDLPPVKHEEIPVVFEAHMATGIWWVDTTKERNGDYVPIAHAMYSNPAVLVVQSPRSKHLAYVRQQHAAKLVAAEIHY